MSDHLQCISNQDAPMFGDKMIIQDTILVVRNTIKACSAIAKAAIVGSIAATVHILKNLPQYIASTIKGVFKGIELGFRLAKYILLNFPTILKNIAKGIFESIKFGFRLGKGICKFFWNLGKAIVENLPEIAKALCNFVEYVIDNLPQILRAVGRGIKKFITSIPDIIKFGWELTKSITKFVVENSLKIAEWFLKNTLNILAKVVGVTLGIVIAPFEIAYEALNELFQRDQNASNERGLGVRERQNHFDSEHLFTEQQSLNFAYHQQGARPEVVTHPDRDDSFHPVASMRNR